MRTWIKGIPVLRDIAKVVYFKLLIPLIRPFRDSKSYWKARYDSGGNSGAGSYGHLANFKGEVLNTFVRDNRIQSVIEFGCGDGNQLRLVAYPSYLGFDVSPAAIRLCRTLFVDDHTKQFALMDDYAGQKSELTLSLDVIYHLVEDRIFDGYMNRLFASATRYVVIYSSNTNEQERFQAPHVKHRRFSDWISRHAPDWQLMKHIPNRFSYHGNDNSGSFSDFYIYKRIIP